MRPTRAQRGSSFQHTTYQNRHSLIQAPRVAWQHQNLILSFCSGPMLTISHFTNRFHIHFRTNYWSRTQPSSPFDDYSFPNRTMFLFSRIVRATCTKIKVHLDDQITVLGIPGHAGTTPSNTLEREFAPGCFSRALNKIYFQLCQTCTNGLLCTGYAAHITTTKSRDLCKKANRSPNNKGD